MPAAKKPTTKTIKINQEQYLLLQALISKEVTDLYECSNYYADQFCRSAFDLKAEKLNDLRGLLEIPSKKKGK
jgi:hypothetical protein